MRISIVIGKSVFGAGYHIIGATVVNEVDGAADASLRILEKMLVGTGYNLYTLQSSFVDELIEDVEEWVNEE